LFKSVAAERGGLRRALGIARLAAPDKVLASDERLLASLLTYSVVKVPLGPVNS
jgi:hypothetical protein